MLSSRRSKCSTAQKNLHAVSLFGAGINSNTSISAETWKLNGGVRSRVSGSGDDGWKYSNFSQSTAGIRKSASATSNACINDLLNKDGAKEQCMESQMAYSFAVETGVAEGAEFTFYGNTYWYSKIAGADADRMNVKVYKFLSQHGISGWNSSNEPAQFDFECVLRMSLFDGMNLCGDVFSLEGGGLELVGYDGGTAADSLVKIYAEPDQSKWLYEESYRLADGGSFPFQEVYKQIGQYTTSRDSGHDGYIRQRMPHAPAPQTFGGGLTTGECAYGVFSNKWYGGSYSVFRAAARSRGYARSAILSPRFADATHSVASAALAYCGSAQVLLNVQQDAVRPQAAASTAE